MVGQRARLPRALRGVAIVLLVALWIFPIYWVLVTSFKLPDDIASRTPNLLPVTWTFEPWQRIFTTHGFGPLLRNSALIAGTTTAIAILVASAAAYALSRFDFPRRDDIALWILSLRLMPGIAVVIPFYMLYQTIQQGTAFPLTDTLHGMVLAYLTFSLPFAIWLLRGFFADVPREVEEAALLDGCTHLGVLRHVIFPITRPGIAVTAIFTFMFAWNEFLFALLLTDREYSTLQVGLNRLVQPFGIPWADLCAGAVLTLLPLLIVVFLLQRHIVRGMTLGAVK